MASRAPLLPAGFAFTPSASPSLSPPPRGTGTATTLGGGPYSPVAALGLARNSGHSGAGALGGELRDIKWDAGVGAPSAASLGGDSFGRSGPAFAEGSADAPGSSAAAGRMASFAAHREAFSPVGAVSGEVRGQHERPCAAAEMDSVMPFSL